jgi:DNA-binding NtrC family response regulator
VSAGLAGEVAADNVTDAAVCRIGFARSLSMDERKQLLIVDDDIIHRTVYSSIAQKLHYHVDLAQSPGDAFEALRAKSYRIVILDLLLGEGSGSDVLVLMSSLPRKPRVLLVTGASDDVIEETFAVGRQLGLEMFGPVRKPVNVTLIRTVLRGMEIGEPSEAKGQAKPSAS